jgi:hypothetical protein
LNGGQSKGKKRTIFEADGATVFFDECALNPKETHMLTRKLVRIALVAMAMAVLQTASAHAAFYLFSANGSGTACSQAQPCSLDQAIFLANGISSVSPELACADNSNSVANSPITHSMTIDCSGTAGGLSGVAVNGSGVTVTLKNLTLCGTDPAVNLFNGTLILDNVNLAGNFNYAINATPTGPSNLVVRNSLIDGNSPAGVLLKPQSGGSLSAKFDHVTVTHNSGAGIRADTTGGGGPVTVDIADSIISDNAANGLIAVSGSGGPSLINITTSTVANNAIAGIAANGSNAGALVDKTLLDGNAGGALAISNGGRIDTYQTNRVVGAQGSAFSGALGFN